LISKKQKSLDLLTLRFSWKNKCFTNIMV